MTIFLYKTIVFMLIIELLVSCKERPISYSQSIYFENQNPSIIDELNSSGLQSISEIASWLSTSIQDKKSFSNYVSDPNLVLIVSNKSLSSSGQQRAIFTKDYLKEVFSLSKRRLEIVVDSGNQLIPSIVKETQTGLVTKPSNTCKNCHTNDFTYIWSVRNNSVFRSSDNTKLDGDLKVLSHSSFNNHHFPQLLVKRAANLLYKKINERKPELFRKNLRLLTALVLRCSLSENIIRSLDNEIEVNNQRIHNFWQKLLENLRVGSHDNNRKKSILENQEVIITPLKLIHYLGVPPHNIFLFKKLSDRDFKKNPEKYFDSVFENHFEAFRMGPLGAYGGENDSIRSYLAALLVGNNFREITLTDEGRYTASSKDFLDLANPEIYSFDSKYKNKLGPLLGDKDSPFNIYGIHNDGRSFFGFSNESTSIEKKNKICEYLLN